MKRTFAKNAVFLVSAAAVIFLSGCQVHPHSAEHEVLTPANELFPHNNLNPSSDKVKKENCMKFPVFKRKFAFSMYKDLRLSLGRMTFAKDFVNDTRGNLYPVLEKSADCCENVQHNRYQVASGEVRRWFCQFFPFASYELSATVQNGCAGFVFQLPDDQQAQILLERSKVVFRAGKEEASVPVPAEAGVVPVLLVTCRPGAFDVYFNINGRPEFCTTFSAPEFKKSRYFQTFSNSGVSLLVRSDVCVKSVESFIDNGISIADIRPVRYEDGTVMVENGKIFLSVTIRQEAGGYQGILSWVPGTAEFELTGALFYDCGDGMWAGDVAASILFHRQRKEWLLWMTAFSHGHILGYGTMTGDPRFGVNVADVKLMDKAPESAPNEYFGGFTNDEDPDFYYDADCGKWRMAICRARNSGYRYFFFESDDPFTGYRFIGKGIKEEAAETGGSFVKIGNERFFICGNSSQKTSNYRIYSANGMSEARFDFPDGGFRGWGTLIPVPAGSRIRYYWLTFDRHLASSANWSYGNLYCFEGDFSESGQ